MNYPLNIMALDPGPKESTFVRCTFTGETNLMGQPLIISGVGSLGNNEMLDKLTGLFGVIVVCEMIACYGMAVGKEVFETCRWIGRFEQKLATHGGKLETLTRMEAKMNLCHSARANDANIRQALIDRFGGVGTRKSPGTLFGISGHAWAALAVGVSFYDSLLRAAQESARLKSIHRPDSVLLSRPSCEAAAGGKL